MSLKIYKKSTLINNLSFFSVLSLIFVHIIISLSKGLSALSIDVAMENAEKYCPLLVIFVIALYSIRRAHKLSKILIPVLSLYVLVIAFIHFFQGFDKIILILNLCYLCFSFYFYSFWQVELSDAVYSPGFSVEDVGLKGDYQFKAKLFFTNGLEGWGHITNSDNNSAFIVVEEHLRKCKGTLKLLVDFENTIFEQYGEVVSSYGGGIGIKFMKNTESSVAYNWEDFYTVISHRGLMSEYHKGL